MNLKNNPELIPLIEWWEKDGKQYVIGLLVAAVVIGGFRLYSSPVRKVNTLFKFFVHYPIICGSIFVALSAPLFVNITLQKKRNVVQY